MKLFKGGVKDCLKIYVNFENAFKILKLCFFNNNSLQNISFSIALRLACRWNLFLNVYFKDINISIVHTKLKNGFLL
jgi:lipopolysaccharide assembly outer membrane protein LptD (OstA)